jgi:very-short-patch-repair endonuclease
MRYQLLKLTQGKSTKAERRFAEMLKQFHIPFRTKVRINNREIDFLIGKYAIDIDGHLQDVEKNSMLLQAGYSPVHFSNNEIGTSAKYFLWDLRNYAGDS